MMHTNLTKCTATDASEKDTYNYLDIHQGIKCVLNRGHDTAMRCLLPSDFLNSKWGHVKIWDIHCIHRMFYAFKSQPLFERTPVS